MRDWAGKFNNAELAKLLKINPAPLSDARIIPAAGAAKPDIRESLGRSLSVIGLAVERAARKALKIDPAVRAEQLRVVRTEFISAKDTLSQGNFISVDSLAFTIMHLIEAGYPADDLTDALVSAQQQADGSFGGLPVARPPVEDSKFVRTAMVARALAKYPIPARRAEFEKRRQASAVLLDSTPRVPYDRSFQLMGLAWTGAPSSAGQRIAAGLERLQRPNGGWAQLESLAADGFATGVALLALRESGMPPTDAVYTRGVEYLLSTQKPDGSWFVASRSPKLRPYFQSGFPHHHDQWISAAATANAAAALIEAAQPARESATCGSPS